jgi:DNA-binding PadR family transcriptional regulator
VIDRALAQAFALKDWIASEKQGRVATYKITQAGRAALKRFAG